MFARAPRAPTQEHATPPIRLRRLTAAFFVLVAVLPVLALPATALPTLTEPPAPRPAALAARSTAADDRAERDAQHRASRSTVRDIPAPPQATPVRHQRPKRPASAKPAHPPTVRAHHVTAARPAPRYVPPAVHGSASAAVTFALAQVGKPYVWGASGPRGYDCSGLVMASWARAGIRLPHSSGGIASAGRRIPMSVARAGDVAVWPGHVALIIRPGWIVEAAHSGVPVHVVPIWGRPYAVRIG